MTQPLPYPKAGSNVVDPRLQRWMTCFAIGLPSAESLTTIYETFMLGHFSEVVWCGVVWCGVRVLSLSS